MYKLLKGTDMGIIEVKNLSFSYDEEDNAVDDVSFSVEEGSYTTIIGHNGSGKSTLISLIPRFYDVKSGAVEVDGVDVQTFTANQVADVTANIVMPQVNDGTLTITVDGITAGTFSANQSSNSVIELTSGGGGSADVQPMSVSIAHSIAASVFGA